MADGGDEWFASRHDRERGPSGSILRLLYVRIFVYSRVPSVSSQLRSSIRHFRQEQTIFQKSISGLGRIVTMGGKIYTVFIYLVPLISIHP